MKLKSIAAALLAGVMTLGLCACGQNQGSQSTAPDPSETLGTAEVKSVTLTESWDFSGGFYAAISPTSSSHGIQYWVGNFYDTLVVRDGDEFKPSLAEDWTISDDAMSYTFQIKEGVLFSDGTQLNAEAVKTSIEAAFHNLGDYATGFVKLSAILDSIEATDTYVLTINLTSPYYGLLNDLALAMPMGIVSPNAFNEDLSTKDELLTQTFGTGPYMYAGDTDGTTYTFVRNPHYYGEAPDADEFKIKIITDIDAAALALRSGEIDIITGSSRLSTDGYMEFSDAEGFGAVIDDHASSTRFIGFNVNKGPFNDVNVRQAVAYAIDKDTLAESVFSGLETAANTFFSRDLPYCDVDTKTYDYNIETAQALLEQSGWVDSDGDSIRKKDGVKLSVTLDYTTDFGALDNAALTIVQQLSEIGMEVTLRGSDNLTWYSYIFGDYEFSLHQTYGGFNDPYVIMTNMNPDLMSDPVLSQITYVVDGGKGLIFELDTTGDFDRVQEIYSKILTTNADQAVLVPLTYMNQYAAFKAKKIALFSFSDNALYIDVAKIKLN